MSRNGVALLLAFSLFLVTPCRAPAAPAVTLTSPAGSDTWAVASPHHITWKSDGLPAEAALKLAYSADGGKTWTAIAESVPNTGRYLWKVPDTVSGTCKVRLSSAAAQVDSAVFAIVASQEVKDYRWVNVTMKAAFAPRDGAGALTFNGRMWFLGGWNPGDKTHFPRICNNEVWSSRDGATWAMEKANSFLDPKFDPLRDWEGRHTAGYVVHQEKMWIIGGDVNQGHYHYDVWHSTDGKTWELANKGQKVPWGPRALHYTVAFRDKIWVIGGQTIPGIAAEQEFFHRDVWTSGDGVKWEKVTPEEPFWPQRGMIGGSAVLRDRIWLLGGGTYDTPKRPERLFFNDVWSTADGVHWKRHLEAAPWAPRQYHDVAVFDGRLWVMEGYYKGNRNDVWYSADGENWYELPNTPWKPRHAASVFVHDNALWMVAGNNMESDVWKLQRK